MPTLLARRSEQRAERLVQREYEELRTPTLAAVRSRLSAQGLRLDDADLDAAYNQAWHGLYEQLVRGEEVDNHGGFLVVAAHRRAIDEVRRVHPDRRAEGVDPEERAHDLDLTQRLDDRRRLLGAMEGMRERLSERERQAAALCYLHGYSRPEAAAALGLAPKRMEKLMDGVSSKLGTLTTEIDEGDWCESRQSLMKAYAYGVLDPDGERYALARAHLEECPACRKYVRSLRGISAVVPPIWLPLAALGVLGIGGAGAASAAGRARRAAGAARGRRRRRPGRGRRLGRRRSRERRDRGGRRRRLGGRLGRRGSAAAHRRPPRSRRRPRRRRPRRPSPRRSGRRGSRRSRRRPPPRRRRRPPRRPSSSRRRRRPLRRRHPLRSPSPPRSREPVEPTADAEPEFGFER